MGKTEMRVCALETCNVEFEAEARKGQKFCCRSHGQINRGYAKEDLPVIGSTKECEREGCSESWIVQGGALRKKKFCSRSHAQLTFVYESRKGENALKPNIFPCCEYVEPLDSRKFNLT